MFQNKTIFFCIILSAFSVFNSEAHNSILTAVPQGFRNDLQGLLIKGIAESLGSDLEIKEAPLARRLYYLKTGAIDISAELLKNPEREEYIHFVNPPYKLKSKKIFIVKKGNRTSIQKYEDLYNLRIGTNIKSSHFKRFDNDQRIIKESAPSFKHNIQKLIHNRIDAVIFTESFALAKIKDMKAETMVEPAVFSYSKYNPVYFGISKKSALMENLEEVEYEIKKMIYSGEIDKIIVKYYKDKKIAVPSYK